LIASNLLVGKFVCFESQGKPVKVKVLEKIGEGRFS